MSLPVSPPTNSSSKEPPDISALSPGPSVQQPSINASPNTASSEQPSISSIRPHFTPFFTLINDIGTSTTHHPVNIHYLFSDDDPSLLTAACLSALQPESSSSSSSSSRTNIQPHPSTTSNPTNHSVSSSTTSATSTSKSASAQQLKVPRYHRGGHDSRMLILDVAPSGTEIIRAHSLSPAWQILSTSLTPAPTWAESPSEMGAGLATSLGEVGAAAAVGGYMLRIGGTEVPEDSNRSGRDATERVRKGDGGKGSEMGMVEGEFAALMKEFDARMNILRTVVAAGEEKKDCIDRDGEGEGEGEGEGDGDREGEAEGDAEGGGDPGRDS